MSDKSEGPGWWIASDGKWYPPELHPSVRDSAHVEAPASDAGGSQQPRRWQGQADKAAPVGRQFPDLFKKAMQGSHLADNVSVIYDGEERRSTDRAPVSMTSNRNGSGAPVAAGVPGATIGAPAKRKWRKGH